MLLLNKGGNRSHNIAHLQAGHALTKSSMFTDWLPDN